MKASGLLSGKHNIVLKLVFYLLQPPNLSHDLNVLDAFVCGCHCIGPRPTYSIINTSPNLIERVRVSVFSRMQYYLRHIWICFSPQVDRHMFFRMLPFLMKSRKYSSDPITLYINIHAYKRVIVTVSYIYIKI